MDNPLDMTKETLERLEAEAAEPEYQHTGPGPGPEYQLGPGPDQHRQEVHKGFAAPSEKEKTEGDLSRVAFVMAVQEERRVPERRLSGENENRCETEKVLVTAVQDEDRTPRRRLSVEYEMMPPPQSPAMRPKSATPRRDFSQPRSEIIEICFFC